MIRVLRQRRLRKQTREALAFLDAHDLRAAERAARNSVPVMPSRHIPTDWWVKP
jgi:hypothetical protein